MRGRGGTLLPKVHVYVQHARCATKVALYPHSLEEGAWVTPGEGVGMAAAAGARTSCAAHGDELHPTRGEGLHDGLIAECAARTVVTGKGTAPSWTSDQ